MSDPIYSETIPCVSCGKKGESLWMVGRWLCGKCISELVTESINKQSKRMSEP